MTAVGDALASARDAQTRHAWQQMFDAATAARVSSGELEAERADLVADAAWWLGRLDDCIAAREQAYLLYDELGDQRRAGMCACGPRSKG